MANTLRLLGLPGFLQNKLLSLIPQLQREIWIISWCGFLFHLGRGFTLVYTPLFLVDQVGLSATEVGVGISIAALSGVFGRFASAYLIDTPRWGSKKSFLLAAIIHIVACLALAFVNSFSTLVLANIFLGLALSFYWPTIKSIGTNYASPKKRNEAFSLNRLADNLGLIIGVFLAGKLVTFTSNYRFLFLLQGLCCAILFVVIYLLLSDTNQEQESKPRTINNQKQNWQQVLQDKGLLIWLGTNVFFTVYESQLHTTMPLYLSKFMSTGVGSKGFLAETISLLFVVHTACNCLLQLPIGKLLNRLSRTYGLIISIVLWGAGFGLIWLAEFMPDYGIVWAVSALIIFSFALSTYVPSASSLMGDLAPESQRGLYFSLDSQCWAVGYLLGPSIGGWALDQSGEFAHNFWLVLGVTFILGVATLLVVERIIYSEVRNKKLGN